MLLKKKYYCSCWHCMTAKEKKAIAREKEMRLFRDGGGDRGKSDVAVNMNPSNGIQRKNM